ARASWNYRLPSCSGGAEQVQVHYDMTRLQRLPTEQEYVVSLHADGQVRPDRVLARMDYAHPQYTPESVAAQSLLPSLNDGVTAFAGAYHGWGFHEDGARSGPTAALSATYLLPLRTLPLARRPRPPAPPPPPLSLADGLPHRRPLRRRPGVHP